MIKYQYAIGSDENPVDIQSLTPETRRDKAPYICFGCGNELTPNLGKIKVKHFSHKNPCECSKETYLHQLGKSVFHSEYVKCLESNTPFIYEFSNKQVCTHHEHFFGFTCEIDFQHKYDLTKVFKVIKVEKRYDTFIPDILLSSHNGEEVIFVEVAVTHKCEPEKIASKKRIFEFEITDESDLVAIRNNHVINNSGLVTYNAEEKFKVGDFCSGICEKELDVFFVYSSGRTTLTQIKPRESMGLDKKSHIKYQKVLGVKHSAIDRVKIYINMLRDVYFTNKIDIKNCYLCKYYGLSGITKKSIFCKLKKENYASNEAVICDSYRAFLSIEDCFEADKKIQSYLKRMGKSYVFDIMRGY